MPPVRLSKWKQLCLILCFLILLYNGPRGGVVHAQVQSQTGLETKNVLVLHAFEANVPILELTDRGLQAALESGGVGIRNQFFEYLDLTRNPGPEHSQHLLDLMRQRYGLRKIDVIITMYPEALRFVLNEGRMIFPDVPILSLYMPEGFELPETDRRIIQHPVRRDIVTTLEIALKLVPGVKRIFVIGGTHELDRNIENQAREGFKKWEGRLEFRYLNNISLEEILTTVSSAPPGTIVLILAFTTDVNGRILTVKEVSKQVSQVSAAPVFGLRDIELGQGIVGGSLISYEQVGTRAGQLTLDILKGANISENMPDALDVPFVPMFDWRQLRRWNLSESALPKGSIVVNREFTLWDLKNYIIGALAFILVQSLMILMLLAQKHRRQSAEESLRQKKEEMDQFFIVTLDLLCIANTAGYFLCLNPAWEKILGYSREELMADRFFDFVHPDDLASTQEAASKLVAQGELIHFENRYRCKDGSYRFLNWSAASVGEIIYAAARDMTERLEVEIEARQRRDELAHLSRVAMMGELTASLAHEINQPLSAIMSNAQAVKRYLNAPTPDMEELKEIISDIVKEDTRAGEIIHRMRALLKNTKMELEPVDLTSTFQEVIGLLHSDSVIRDVKVSTELDPRLPPVRGDRIQLQQVVLNLMLNAFEAMTAQPREERQVIVRTWQKDAEVLAAVTDYGMGFPAGETEKIFQPFYTTKNQGLGMGLSISRSIIIRHQGRIWAENNPGGGTTFYFSLRVATDEQVLS